MKLNKRDLVARLAAWHDCIYNILRLGKNKDVIIKNAFNPVKLREMNELCDIAYFKWQPADRG